MDPSSTLQELQALLTQGPGVEGRAKAESVLCRPPSEFRGNLREAARLAEGYGLSSQAIAFWRVLYEENPQNTEALERLASLALAEGSLETSLELLRTLHALEGGTSETKRDQLEILVQLGRTDEAVAQIQEWSKNLDPDHPLLTEFNSLLETPAFLSPTEEVGRMGSPSPISTPGTDPDTPSFRPILAAPTDPPIPSDADVIRFLHRFSGREDCYARMWIDENGRIGYSPVREPLTPKIIRNHLLGNVTVGVYPIRLDGRVGFFAVDLDITRRALEEAKGDPTKAQAIRKTVRENGEAIAQILVGLGIPFLFEVSGFKGRHYWVFLDPPLPAQMIFDLGRYLIPFLDPRHPDTHLEFFPKQPTVRGGPGNLIKLPLGIHLKTGRYSRFLDEAGAPITDPHTHLRQILQAGEGLIHQVFQEIRSKMGPITPAPKRVPYATQPTRETAGDETGPAPPPPPPAWTEEDFKRDRVVHHLLASCPVLDTIVKRTLEHRRVTADEIVVLRNTLGYIPSGVLAVNYLLTRCEEIPSGALLQSELRGNPISCARIRKRVPHITGSAPCACDFSDTLGSYPNPLLHKRTQPPKTENQAPPLPGDPAGRSPEELARILGGLERRKTEIEAQVASIVKTILEFLARSGGDRVSLPEGVYCRKVEDGLETLVWEPNPGPPPGPDSQQVSA